MDVSGRETAIELATGAIFENPSIARPSWTSACPDRWTETLSAAVHGRSARSFSRGGRSRRAYSSTVIATFTLMYATAWSSGFRKIVRPRFAYTSSPAGGAGGGACAPAR